MESQYQQRRLTNRNPVENDSKYTAEADGQKTIIAGNSHSGGEEDDMEKGRYKEVEAQNLVAAEVQVAEEVHYSRDPATLDMQVGHTRGSVEAVVDVEVDMVDLELASCKAVEAAAVEHHKVVDFEYNQALQADEGVGKQEPEVEQHWEYSRGLLAVGDWILEPDETEQQKDNYSHLNLYSPEN